MNKRAGEIRVYGGAFYSPEINPRTGKMASLHMVEYEMVYGPKSKHPIAVYVGGVRYVREKEGVNHE
jgi:hypothetical protein